jgi:16S rRNA (guanine527-N7)-methyltransferase
MEAIRLTGAKHGRQEFCEIFDVSRETLARLDKFELLLRRWTQTINLISRSAVDELWHRHIIDSAQIYELAGDRVGHWVDIGSGGGFPGIVVAILALEKHPDKRFSLIESNQRKAMFLRTIARELDLPVQVFADRIEDLDRLNADIISARAVAPLKLLLKYAEPHLNPPGRALFHKGAAFRRELSEALESWTFQSDEYTSITDGTAVVLSIGDIRRV